MLLKSSRFLLIAGFCIAAPLTVHAQSKIEYNRDIRPILAENCFACHGPDSASRKAGLRLDQQEVAVKKKAIVPGKLKESELVQRILRKGRGMMPPVSSHKKLTEAQKEL